MEAIDLLTGFILTAFPDYRSTKAYAEDQQRRGHRVSYYGKLEWARPMELKRWPSQVPGLGFMDYQFPPEHYDLHKRVGVPHTYDTAKESVRSAVAELGKRQDFTAEYIVVVNRW